MCAGNYEVELLIDMGIAMTTPHYLFKSRPSWQVRVMQREDLLMTDKVCTLLKRFLSFQHLASTLYRNRDTKFEIA